MSQLELACVAAVAMLFQDIIATVMVQSEAKNKGWTAGWLDAAGYLVGIVCAKIVIKSHGAGEVEALVLVTVANVLGTKLGQVTGQRFLDKKTALDPARNDRPVHSE